MPQPKRLGLTKVDATHITGDNRIKMISHLVLAFGAQQHVQFGIRIEVISNGSLRTPNDKYQMGDPRGDSFFNGKLDDGLVDDSQHFFGLCLGRWEKACSQTCNWKNSFSYRSPHATFPEDTNENSVNWLTTRAPFWPIMSKTIPPTFVTPEGTAPPLVGELGLKLVIINFQ